MALIWCVIRSGGTWSRLGACSMILHRLSAAAPAEGNPKVAASPLMSWAARNSSSRVESVKPSLRISAWAAVSLSASIAIQFLNSPDRPARAFSARAIGSSRSLSATRRSTLRSGLGCVITLWSAKDLTCIVPGLSLVIVVSSVARASNSRPLHSRSGLVEQRRLRKDFRFAADAALGADIGVGGIAPAVRAEIGFGLDERAGIGDHVENALIEPLGRDRLGQKLGHAGVARDRDAALFGMAGQHDDGGVGIALGFRLADHLGKLEAVENRHRPVGDDDIGNVVAVHFERGGAVLGLVSLARAERMQQRPQDAAHMRIVVANQKSQLVEVDAIHGPGPGGHTRPNGIPGVNHIAAEVNEWLPNRRRGAGCGAEISARTARAKCVPRGCGR